MAKKKKRAGGNRTQNTRNACGLFKERMYAEGRGDEWEAEFAKQAQISRDAGRYNGGWATWAAMEAMGYDKTDPDALRKEIVMAEGRVRNRQKEDWLSVYVELPDSCPPADTMRWISQHPLMVKANQEDGLEGYRLSGFDVDTAPSKEAVGALQNWILRPKDFYQSIIGEWKKISESQADLKEREVIKDVGIDEIEGMLKNIGLKCPKCGTEVLSGK